MCCRVFDKHFDVRPFSFALLNAGNSIEINNVISAITTNISIKLNARRM